MNTLKNSITINNPSGEPQGASGIFVLIQDGTGSRTITNYKTYDKVGFNESTVKWQVALTDESFSFKILKMIEIKSILNKAKNVNLKVCEKISNFMKENFIEDLKYFENIIPCGIEGKDVTSIERETNKKVDIADIEKKLINNLSEVFEFKILDDEI